MSTVEPMRDTVVGLRVKRSTLPLSYSNPNRATIPQPGASGNRSGTTSLSRLARNVKHSLALAATSNSSSNSSSAESGFITSRPHTSAAVLDGHSIVNLFPSMPTQPPTCTPLDNYFHGLNYLGMVGGYWQHYSAYSTIGGKNASLLIFDKKRNVKAPARLGRIDRLGLIDLLRYDVGQLLQLAHPKILSTVHPLAENKEMLCFACEPIYTTLEQLYEQQALDNIETRIGIIQLSDGLSYLHNSAKILHGNLRPCAVFVTTQHHWKLANFTFSVLGKKPNIFPCYPWTKRLPMCLQPDLDFLAPEYLEPNNHTVSTAADVFSFGILICWILAGGKRLIDVKNNLESYQIVVDQLDVALNLMEKQLSDSLKQILTKALSKDVAQRPTARQITMNKYFDDPPLNALRSLDDIGQEFDPTNKASFLSHTLLTVLPAIPEPLWFSRILLRFNEQLLDSVELYPVILKPLAHILNNCESHNIPKLIDWFRLILDNAQEKALSQAVVDNMAIIFRRLNDEQVEDRCFDLLLFILSGSDPHLKQTVLRALPQIVDYLPLSFIGQKLVPMLASMASFFEQHIARQIDLLVSIVHLSDRCDANLLKSLLSVAALCNAIHPAVIHLKSRLVQRIVTCDVNRLNDPLVVAHYLLNPLVLGLALPEMSSSHFEEVMSSSRVLLEIIEQLRYQSGNFLNSNENGRRLCNRRVSMSSNHLPRLLVTAARPSFGGDGRKMSFLSADGRLEDGGSRRESKDSRCSFESDVSLKIGNGSDISDDSAMHAAGSRASGSSGQRGRRKSWLEGYMHSVSLEQSTQAHPFNNERRGSAIERHFRRSVMSDRCRTNLGNTNAIPLPPPLSHSVCGYAPATEPSNSLNDMQAAAASTQKPTTAKPTPFTNLGHNLACTLWKTFY